MANHLTRRAWMSAVAALPLAAATPAKPMRGIFIIMATPFTETGMVDYEDLRREVAFLSGCGVHGMVWPQMASEYTTLTPEERRRGMKVLAKAAAGQSPALVLGVQGANVQSALEYLKLAEELGPDALIAIPPTSASSVDDYRRYYATLAESANRPLFIQTTGGAKAIIPPVEMLTALAREFPHLGYVKEEAAPVTERMLALAAGRPAVKSVFSGNAGKGMLYEWRLGMDGTMPGAPFSDAYVRIWDAWRTGGHEQAREIFSRLLLMINLDSVIPGTRQYIMKRRGVFKTTFSRRQNITLSAKAVEEIEFCFDGLRPYLKV
ncbi:MAG: dihydrodipicolinate synthase family protein [Bryobacterales bacterium]|nr:dihydrodipicolinate synthase family protein [Bryobacterales bacterium]